MKKLQIFPCPRLLHVSLALEHSHSLVLAYATTPGYLSNQILSLSLFLSIYLSLVVSICLLSSCTGDFRSTLRVQVRYVESFFEKGPHTSFSLSLPLFLSYCFLLFVGSVTNTPTRHVSPFNYAKSCFVCAYRSQSSCE